MTKKRYVKPKLFRWGKRPPLRQVMVTVDPDGRMKIVSTPPSRDTCTAPVFFFDESANRLILVYWCDRELPDQAEQDYFKPHILKFVQANA